MNRRQFTLGLAAMAGAAALPQNLCAEDTSLPAWSPGHLDIHHIDTGRGNATFLICPDGTTLLIDCGASNDGLDVSAPPRPDASRRPGEWVARYALRAARSANRNSLDYAIATHIHPDHVGDIAPSATTFRSSPFAPTGISEVDQFMPITTMIDRSYPDYGLLPPPDVAFAANYLAWLSARRAAGRAVEKIEVGSDLQVTSHSSSGDQRFSVRAIAANGRVWTRRGTETRTAFPDISALAPEDRPGENSLSIALRISYGPFSYFSGGDLTAETYDGRLPWMDVETPAVRACGPVDVAVADHHGYFDACGPEFTKTLNAQAYVVPSWHVTHPGTAQIERLIGAWPGERPRDVFLTEMLNANRLLNARWISQLRSTQGHIIVRVAPLGKTFRIFVTDSSKENGAVISSFGPYTSGSSDK